MHLLHHGVAIEEQAAGAGIGARRAAEGVREEARDARPAGVDADVVAVCKQRRRAACQVGRRRGGIEFPVHCGWPAGWFPLLQTLWNRFSEFCNVGLFSRLTSGGDGAVKLDK
eukprot:353632-Chlamydomonas_euryale.AAC.7